MPAAAKVSKKAKDVTGAYMVGLKRSLSRIDSQDFTHYNVKLKEPRLIKFLLAKCYAEKLYMPQLIEKLIVSGLSKDKNYKDYVKNNLSVIIETIDTIRMEPIKVVTDQQEQRKGHSDRTAF